MFHAQDTVLQFTVKQGCESGVYRLTPELSPLLLTMPMHTHV